MAGDLKLVVLVHPVVQVQPHDERHGRIQEVHEVCRKNRHVDVLPLEREEQGRDALCDQHQTVILCKETNRPGTINNPAGVGRARWAGLIASGMGL